MVRNIFKGVPVVLTETPPSNIMEPGHEHEMSSGMTSQSEVAVSIVPATLVTSGYSAMSRFISADNVTYVYAAMATEDETENQPEVTSTNGVESTFDSAQAENAYEEISQNIGNADSTVQVVKGSVEAARDMDEQGGVNKLLNTSLRQ